MRLEEVNLTGKFFELILSGKIARVCVMRAELGKVTYKTYQMDRIKLDNNLQSTNE